MFQLKSSLGSIRPYGIYKELTEGRLPIIEGQETLFVWVDVCVELKKEVCGQIESLKGMIGLYPLLEGLVEDLTRMS